MDLKQSLMSVELAASIRLTTANALFYILHHPKKDGVVAQSTPLHDALLLYAKMLATANCLTRDKTKTSG